MTTLRAASIVREHAIAAPVSARTKMMPLSAPPANALLKVRTTLALTKTPVAASAGCVRQGRCECAFETISIGCIHSV